MKNKVVIKRVRATSKPKGWYRDRTGKRRFSNACWYVYWRVIIDGRLVNTFLKKSTAVHWVRRQQT